MKKIILFLCLSCCGTLSAQDHVLNSELKKELINFLNEREPGNSPYTDTIIIVRDLMKDEVMRSSIDTCKYGIYSFETLSIPSFAHVFIKNNDQYKTIRMNALLDIDYPFANILQELIEYFNDNPDLDDPKYNRLCYYTRAVCGVYLKNLQELEKSARKIKRD